jgi:archaellum biogenesis ATPase FlaH
MTIENTIINHLIYNENYTRKTLPFVKKEYFTSYTDKVLFGLVEDYVRKYNTIPTKEALFIELNGLDNISQDVYKQCHEALMSLQEPDKVNENWLYETTEKFCQDKALYNAIMESIHILDDKTSKNSKGSIPQILSDALAVSFDTHIGHDFIEDYDSRYDFYHTKEVKIPFDLDYFNRITKGGLSRKTLTVVLAGTGTGKSLFMCHAAAANLMSNLNVLYITMEMAEERIAERIDANIMNLTTDEIKTLPKQSYINKIEKMRTKTNGKLIIKEYPTACAGSANFRHLLSELKIKRKFIPDIIYIDYLNICMSSRLKNGNGVNSYTYIKAIAEELRGLAVEFNVPIVTATQTTRGGYNNSNLGLEDTSESFGLPATADFMFALITTEELEELNQIMVKQLKNRYADPNKYKRFVIGIDRSIMKLYDVEQEAQDELIEESVMDTGKFMEEDRERNKPKNKYDRSKFQGFK